VPVDEGGDVEIGGWVACGSATVGPLNCVEYPNVTFCPDEPEVNTK